MDIMLPTAKWLQYVALSSCSGFRSSFGARRSERGLLAGGLCGGCSGMLTERLASKQLHAYSITNLASPTLFRRIYVRFKFLFSCIFSGPAKGGVLIVDIFDRVGRMEKILPYSPNLGPENLNIF
jgi:hypothetical protein